MADLNAVPGLKRRLAATRRRMTALALGRAFWAPLLLAALFVLAALFGAIDGLDPALRASLIVGAGLLFALLLLRGLRRYDPPTAADAARAFDAQSPLRPVAALGDRPAKPTRDGQALWSAHDARLREAAGALKPPSTWTDWQTLDRAGLRFALPVMLVAGLVFAGPETGERLRRAVSPDLGLLMGAESIRVEAWITPPAYSGRPPVFLKPGAGDVRVPAGSKVTLRAQARSAPWLVLAASDRRRLRFEETPDGAYEAVAEIAEDTRVEVRWWGLRQAWRVLASPDAPPEAAFAAVPTLTSRDRTEFSWSAADDYGVETLELSLRLVEPHPAAPDAVDRTPVALPAVAPKSANDTAVLDLTRHPWAGLEVEARMVATDGAGQEGASAPHVFVLPEKLFLQPLAKAAQEARVTVLRDPRGYAEPGEWRDPSALKDGALNLAAANRLDRAPDEVRRAALMIDALTYEPRRYFRDYSVYLGLRNAHALLETASTKPEADAVDPILWAVALKAEYGSSADALRALQAARKALEQALRDGAPEEVISRLMEAFKDAAQNYLAAKMAEAMANGLPEAPDTRDGEAGDGPSFGGQDFSDMLEALEDLTETGAADQARQLLSDITNLLENLEFQQGDGSGEGGFPGLPGQGGEGEEGDASPQERELSETLQELSDILREQRELNDDTLAQGRGEQPGGQTGERGADQGQEGESGRNGAQGETDDGTGGGGRGLADRQDDLGDLAEQFARRFGERGGEAGEAGDGLGRFEDEALRAILEAQRRAAEALRQGRQGLAEREQERATRMLRDLAGAVAEQLDELRDDADGDAQDADTDPFGRPVGGANDADSVKVPDEAERQRAKDILDELRRRYGDSDEPDERDYLDRLLDRF